MVTPRLISIFETLLPVKVALGVSLAIYSSVAGGCKRESARTFPPISELVSGATSQNPARFDNAVICLDGTLSMQGFSKPTQSSYVEILQALDRAAGQLVGAPNVSYRKFGSKIFDPGAKEPLYVSASRPSFYSGSGNYVTTRADLALEQAGNSKLIVVVTDLFQDQSDVSAIERAAQQLGFPKTKSVLIWQWELPFEGTIYDYDLRASRGALYRGNRPLYFFVVGSERTVIDFSRILAQTSAGLKSESLAISSHFLASQNSWLAMKNLEGLVLSNRISGSVPTPVLSLRNGCSAAEVSATSVLQPSNFGLQLDLKKLESTSSSDTVAELDEVVSEERSRKLRLVASPSVSVTEKRASGGQTFTIRFDCAAVTARGTYVLVLKRNANLDDVIIPPWVRTSNLEARGDLAIAAKDWGNRTLNFLPLVSDLTAIALNLGPIATQYFFVVRS